MPNDVRKSDGSICGRHVRFRQPCKRRKAIGQAGFDARIPDRRDLTPDVRMLPEPSGHEPGDLAPACGQLGNHRADLFSGMR